jgi:glycosyltransferase involved in cell wall biosynthesis
MTASIIINNFNYAPFLRAAIDSALEQTWPSVEVIVVDDGSTDNSRGVIESYRRRVTPIFKDNGGQASACNAGFAASKGDVVIFLDADDTLSSTAVEAAIDVLRDPAIVKVHWPAREIDEAGRDLGRIKPNRPLAEGNLREEVIQMGQTIFEHASTSANAWSRTFLDVVMPIMDSGDRHGADAYLNALAPIYGYIGLISGPLGSYRVHQTNYAAHMSLREKFERHMRRYVLLRDELERRLAAQGVEVNREEWKSSDTYYGWRGDMLLASREMETVIPRGSTFIFVDDNQLGYDFVPDRVAIPFPEKDGAFAGYPADDAAAIAELERLKAQGAGFIVFIRTTTWWLSHYERFHAFLRKTARCIVDDERVIIFDLRQAIACASQ